MSVRLYHPSGNTVTVRDAETVKHSKVQKLLAGGYRTLGGQTGDSVEPPAKRTRRARKQAASSGQTTSAAAPPGPDGEPALPPTEGSSR